MERDVEIEPSASTSRKSPRKKSRAISSWSKPQSACRVAYQGCAEPGMAGDDAVDVEDEDGTGTHRRPSSTPLAEDSPLQLVVPVFAYLDDYADALKRGWSADNVHPQEAARDELACIDADPAAFVALLDDREAWRSPSPCPTARRWRACRAIAAGYGTMASAARSAFAGNPARRPCHPNGWAMSVMPSSRGGAVAVTPRAPSPCCCPRRGEEGLACVELTTDLDNLPSQKVITAKMAACW